MFLYEYDVEHLHCIHMLTHTTSLLEFKHKQTNRARTYYTHFMRRMKFPKLSNQSALTVSELCYQIIFIAFIFFSSGQKT